MISTVCSLLCVQCARCGVYSVLAVMCTVCSLLCVQCARCGVYSVLAVMCTVKLDVEADLIVCLADTDVIILVY